ncbi:putative short-chain dehydrogenase [Actinoplanes missouriensis 431]|uniref:Putative short-chain dehydrogenase n=1 Tax=Actinoplanes missouriensis (strain ATCC 14538 / DSM 43046 / CBS 188.64 / JCM 3121 / NBRC 102363 / NCIMB 12654 / NRRL B-3342 / UNCC 431) TaxID=512565 RepID=I0H5R8_ACTM4|nr:SDR family oxidoreductase [Actinoplanes missouriensis]BAL88355.1 putative short-chain dehydrogenase [Actinoplanes missouriensis 431]
MSSRFDGKVALVSGGGVGIGFATAKQLIAEGATVFVTSRTVEQLRAAEAALGPKLIGVRADAGSKEDIEALIEQITSTTGKLDILFANAAAASYQTLGEITEEALDRQLGVNIKGLIFLVQAALPLMVDGGSIIMTSSLAAQQGVPAASVYAATKAAMRSFARTWALELADRKIRVNVVTSGPIASEGFKSGEMDDSFKAFIDDAVRRSPARRIGEPFEMANTVTFLASDAASFINGADIPVDGGLGQI